MITCFCCRQRSSFSRDTIELDGGWSAFRAVKMGWDACNGNAGRHKFATPRIKDWLQLWIAKRIPHSAISWLLAPGVCSMPSFDARCRHACLRQGACSRLASWCCQVAGSPAVHNACWLGRHDAGCESPSVYACLLQPQQDVGEGRCCSLWLHLPPHLTAAAAVVA